MKKYLTVIVTDKPINNYLQTHELYMFGTLQESKVYIIADDEIDIIHESELPGMSKEPIGIFGENLHQYITNGKNKTIKE